MSPTLLGLPVLGNYDEKYAEAEKGIHSFIICYSWGVNNHFTYISTCFGPIPLFWPTLDSIWNENMWSGITVADLLPCLEDFTVSLVNSDYIFCTIYSWLMIGIERKRCNKVNVCTEHSGIGLPTLPSDSYLHFWWTWHENKTSILWKSIWNAAASLILTCL